MPLRDETFEALCFRGSDEIGQVRLQFDGIPNGTAQLRQDALFQQRPSPGEGLAHDIVARQHEDVENVKENRGLRRAVILEEVERRFAGFVEGDHLAVDYGFIRQAGKGFDDRRIALAEIVVVARAQRDTAGAFDRERTIAVELDFIKPVGALGQSLPSLQEHGLDESCFDGAADHGPECITTPAVTRGATCYRESPFTMRRNLFLRIISAGDRGERFSQFSNSRSDPAALRAGEETRCRLKR
jgi:hypothetical protein